MDIQQVEKIKEMLKNRSLIGEFVGHPSLPHIVIYPKPTLRFYALVDHDSNETCIAPSETLSWLKSVGLTSVHYRIHPETASEEDFFN